MDTKKIISENIELAVSDGTKMGAYVARPDAKIASPGIIVFQEAYGVNAYIKDIAQRLAREGYVAIAPELFHRTAPGFQGSYEDFPAAMPHVQALTEQGLVADMQAAYQRLLSDKQVDAKKIASLGFCMGGRAAFLADIALPVQAGISFYGGGIAQTLLHRVPELHAPVLFFWGGRDTHILPEHRRAVISAMDKAKKPYVNIEFSDAPHGFFCDWRASYDPQATKQAWPLTLAFLKTHLGL